MSSRFLFFIFIFVREFSKRMDMDLPFYYWTLNERFSDEAYPSFDGRPQVEEDTDDTRNHPLRLHRLRINQREDSSIFVVGRAHQPARHRQTIRQSFHRPGNYLPPPPHMPWRRHDISHCLTYWKLYVTNNNNILSWKHYG